MKKKYLMLMLVLSGIPFAARLGAQDTLNVDFTGMTPHVGQDLHLFLRDPVNGDNIDSVSVVPVDTAAFTVSFGSIVPGNSYLLDFYADLNMNGMYDVPPTDHAWRIELDNLEGDTTIAFVHNTDFTDITWDADTTATVYSLTLEFTGMTPHLDQDLTVYLRNPISGEFYDSVKVSPVDTANFSVNFESLAADSNYYVDFYADHNQNGQYDVPPTDHAWRLMVNNLESDTTLTFAHNTDFTDITWETGNGGDTTLYQVMLHLTSMGPHEGQNMTFYIEDVESGEALDSLYVSPVDSSDFTIVFDSLQVSMDYNLDFWADLNANGSYDVPPTDHAWRIELLDIQSDTTLEFVHNTTFFDIFEEGDTTSGGTYQLTLNFTAMDSIDGNDFLVFLRDPETGDIVDSSSVSAVDTVDFTVVFEDIEVNIDYHVDFYADANGNGSYDVPPADQAWRIILANIQSDTTVIFVYNNNFTDIELEDVGTGTGGIDKEAGFIAYPNPVRNELTVNLKKSGIGLSVYNTAGALVLKRKLSPADRHIQMNVSSLKPGIYILRLDSESGSSQQKFMKE